MSQMNVHLDCLRTPLDLVWWDLLGSEGVCHSEGGGRSLVMRLSLLHWLLLPHSFQLVIKPQTVLGTCWKCLKWWSTCHAWRDIEPPELPTSNTHISIPRSSIKVSDYLRVCFVCLFISC